MKRTFSIKDVLFILFITTLIASMTFPVLAQSRGDGSDACASNLKKLDSAWLMYTEDHTTSCHRGRPFQFHHLNDKGGFRVIAFLKNGEVEELEPRPYQPGQVASYAFVRGGGGKLEFEGRRDLLLSEVEKIEVEDQALTPAVYSPAILPKTNR